MTRLKAYRNAELEIYESVLIIENVWRTMRVQIETLRDHWNDLPGELQVHENGLLVVLQSKIQLAISMIDGLVKSDSSTLSQKANKSKGKHAAVKNLKYATTGRNSLYEIIDDLEKWQTRFDRSWFLLTRVRSSSLDKSMTDSASQNAPLGQMRELRKAAEVDSLGACNNQMVESGSTSVFLQAKDFLYDEKHRINYSDAQLAIRQCGDEADQIVIVDRAPRSMTKRDVRSLARKFAGLNPLIVHLLACEGVIEHKDDRGCHQGFEFVFKLIPGFENLRTLRSALLEASLLPSITERIALATSLARSLIFLHEARFVHKNIRPETIILLAEVSSPQKLGRPFIIGFVEIRSDDKDTTLRGDDEIDKNLYRHPQRQGLYIQERYNVRHDIYSLGVCLLEIGIWESFVLYNQPSGEHDKTDPSGTEVPLPIEDFRILQPFKLKRLLADSARARLPAKMGDRYTDVVLSCLTCLDSDSAVFGDLSEFIDEDGIIVGVRFVEKARF